MSNEKDLPMEYVLNLKADRKQAKLTQQEVADRLDIPRSQLIRYEKGINELPIRYLIKLCRIYNTTPNEMLSYQSLQEDVE